MPSDQILVLLILTASTILYIGQWLSVEVVSLLTILALLVSGVLAPAEALSGFSSSATITIGAMFVLSAGIMRTGALDGLTDGLVRWSAGKPQRLLLLIALVVPLASGFMNNTPLVVLLIPVMLTLGKRTGVAPSRLLLPVAYLASIGGTLTLIGTSTNILVDDIYRTLGGPGIGFFEITPLGLLYAVVGAVYVLIFSRWLLPERAPLSGLAAGRDGAVYISEIDVGPQSTLVGRSAESAFSRIARLRRPAPSHAPRSHRRVVSSRRLTDVIEQARQGVELLEVVRDGVIYRADEARPLLLAAGDRLLVAGSPSEIASLLRSTRSSLTTVLADDQRTPVRSVEQSVIEAVVLPDSTVRSRAPSDLGLHHLYGVSIMGVQRYGQQRSTGLRDLRLASGDVLLLRGPQEGLRAACEATNLLILEGVEKSIARGGKRWIALSTMAAVVLLASLTPIPIVSRALAGALVMILGGCLSPREAFTSLDSTSLLLLAGTIPLGIAMESSGLAQRLVDGLVAAIGVEQPWLFVSLFFFVTWILTELLSNNAVAVLLTPIALSLSRTTGTSETALIMVIIFGASASFTLPQGYQTNAMVMGPGGYRFVDYVRFGLPLSLLCWVAASFLIPLLYPLTP